MPRAFLAALLALAACAGPAPLPPDSGEETVITDFTLGPPGARPGACYGKDVTPAVIERLSEKKLVSPARFGPDGTIVAPATYQETTSNKVVKPRKVIYFETPCPPRWTPDFIASLQRALAARGLYPGPASGTLDTATRQAIRAFQLRGGLNSAILSTESARALGLVEVDLASPDASGLQ